MPKKVKPEITFKVLAHDIALKLPYHFEHADKPSTGQIDWDAGEIRISNRTESGVKRPFTTLIAFIFHELGHMWSQASGHNIFESDDDDEGAKKDFALNAFSELMVQTLLESGMLNPVWLAKVKKLADE